MPFNFLNYTTFGDTIYSLCIIKMLGGGNLYVRLNYLDEFCMKVLGWGRNPHPNRLTLDDFNQIQPLLSAQNYLQNVGIWQSDTIDFDLASKNWQWILPQGWQGNQTQVYALSLGWDIRDPAINHKLLHEPWLTPVDPISIPGKSIVVNRTSRYLQADAHPKWFELIENKLCEQAVFVGSPSEHESFERLFKVQIDFFPTNNLLELCRVIQGSELFVGNQSIALALAIGLGKPYLCEQNEQTATPTPNGAGGDCWFPRDNGKYF
jgi:hypothetical protein